MGIYCFNTSFLYEQLIRDAATPSSSHDFGKDLIPYAIERGYPVLAHSFATSCVNMVGDRPYWRDLGTIDAYWEANLDLVQVTPDLNLYDESWPLWSYQEQLPPAKFVFDDADRRGMAVDSMVSNGCIVSGSTVRRSLLFSNVRVREGWTIEDAVILPDVEVGVMLERAVVEKGCKLPPGLQVGVDPDADRSRFLVAECGVALITPQMLGQEIHHLL
jgi:glucose-1-phosphate adenylyltransferase